MNLPQYSPAATAGGNPDSPPVCQNCATATTPLWRRDELGNVLCNACGLFAKLHGRPRPISLKTDVIKSRNRMKHPQQRKQESTIPTNNKKPTQTLTPFAAAHPDTARSALTHADPTQDGSNIAPQHLFDTVSLSTPDSFAAFGTPTANPLNEQMPQTWDGLVAQNSNLRTRVSELEVINELFRGRVAELEQSEADARRETTRLEKEVDEVRKILLLGRSDGDQNGIEIPDAVAPANVSDEQSGEGSAPLRKRPRIVGQDGETIESAVMGLVASEAEGAGAQARETESNFMMP